MTGSPLALDEAYTLKIADSRKVPFLLTERV